MKYVNLFQKATRFFDLTLTLIVTLLSLITLIGCGEDDETPIPPKLPEVSTAAISNITKTSAGGGGNVVSDGGAEIVARGVCWGLTENPDITNSKTSDGIGVGSFNSVIEGLAHNTTYFVRAYATNSVGTGYGPQVSFTTDDLSLLDDLISYWTLDQTAGNTATDAAGNWSLNLVNSPTWFTPGKKGNAVDFGTESIRYLEKTGFYTPNKNTYSLAAWVYLEDESADLKYIMGMNSGGYAENAGAAEVKIYLDAENKLAAMYFTNDGVNHGTESVMLRTSGASLLLNTWYHVVGVIDDGTVQLYINGQIDNSNETENSVKTNLYITNGRITVGNARLYKQTYIASRWWRGKLDEVGIWSRPLRSTDVLKLYNEGDPLQHPFD